MIRNTSSKWLIIFCLVVAGEMIFSLPLHVARYFRPTFLEGFNLSNAALGDIFAVYGITAMLAYYPGGSIADRFSARKLITASGLIGVLWCAFLYCTRHRTNGAGRRRAHDWQDEGL